jgi:hypothetical protein
VTGNSDSFERAIDSAEAALGTFNPDVLQTAAALQILQGRADEAGDEIMQIAPRATAASAGLGGLELAAIGTSTAFAGLSVATVATLIPALVTLSTVLIPLVAALGGFIAIAGGIVGIGLVGTMAAIATNTERLKEEAVAVGQQLQEAFAPAIEEATVLLTMLLEEFAEIIPELVPTQEVINELSAQFFALGKTLINLLPAFVDLAVTLAREFLPGFRAFVREVGPQIPGIIRGMVDAFVAFLPTLEAFGSFLANNSDELLEFGFTVLHVVVPALAAFGNAVVTFASFVNDLDSGLSRLAISTTLLAPVFAGLALLLSGPVALAIAGVITSVVALRQAFATNFAGIREDVSALGDAIEPVMESAQAAFDAFITGVDLPTLTSDIEDFTGVLDEELTATMEAFRPVFEDVGTLFENNEDTFRNIGAVVGFIAGAMLDLAGVLVQVVIPALNTVLVPVLRGVIQILDFGLQKLGDFIELVGAIRSGEPLQAIEAAGAFTGNETGLNISETIQQNQQNQQRLEIVLDERTDIVDSRIKNGADEVITEYERRATRNTGGTRTP